jgi:hypothetical protein
MKSKYALLLLGCTIVFDCRLCAADHTDTTIAEIAVRANFSEIIIPTPKGYLAVSKVDPLLKELWEGNLKDREKIAVYISPIDKSSVQQGNAPVLIRQAFVASTGLFSDLFFNDRDFQQYKDMMRGMTKKTNQGGFQSVADLVEAERQSTYRISDVTMVQSSFATDRILLTLMVGTEPETREDNGRPLRFAKACAFVNVRGNLICCYMLGKPSELLELESGCFKWAEEIVARNPSTMFERLREFFPFHSAYTE